jgi:hypothetical protein
MHHIKRVAERKANIPGSIRFVLINLKTTEVLSWLASVAGNETALQSE